MLDGTILEIIQCPFCQILYSNKHILIIMLQNRDCFFEVLADCEYVRDWYTGDRLDQGRPSWPAFRINIISRGVHCETPRLEISFPDA